MNDARRYVVAYDIVDTRMRNRVAAVLSAYGERMQKSVFEAVAPPVEMEKCIAQLKPLLANDADSLVVYRLCRACNQDRRYFGSANNAIAEEDVFII